VELLGGASPAPSHSARAHGIVIIVSLLGMLLVLASTARYGSGLSPDSAHYIATARSLAAGKGFHSFSGWPYVTWPPLFPAALAALTFLGVDPLDGARLLNAFVFGLTIYAFGRLLLRNVGSTALALLGAAAMVSAPLLRASAMAWSEPLFVLLVLLFLMALARFLESGRPRDLVLASALAALCSLERYAGAAAVMTGCAVIMLRAPKGAWVWKLGHAAVFAVISITPVALWLLRNYLLTSTPAGTRSPSGLTVWQSIRYTLDTATGWVLSGTPHWAVRVMVIGLAAAAVLVAARRLKGKRAAVLSARKADLLAMGAFALAFASFQIAVSSLLSLDRIGDRLLIPLFVPVMFFVVVAADSSRATWEHAVGDARRPRAIVTALFAIWLLCSWSSAVAHAVRYARRGVGGYATAEWIASPTMGWPREHPPSSCLYSNAPDAVYLLTGFRSRCTPRDEADLEELKAEASAGTGSYVVWFDRTKRTYLQPVDELIPALGLKEAKRFPDGTVYAMK